MIDEKTKQKLIRELEKSGNVYVSCHQLGIHPSTLYRWKSKNKQFRKAVNDAIRIGRNNGADIAEHALMINIKKGDMNAIKYYLSHNAPRYRPKNRKVIFEHSNSERDRQRLTDKENGSKIDDHVEKLNKLIEDLENNRFNDESED